MPRRLSPTTSKFRRKNFPWTPEQELELVQSVLRYGSKWSKILQSTNFTGRLPVDLKDKWKNLRKIALNEHSKAGAALDTSVRLAIVEHCAQHPSPTVLPTRADPKTTSATKPAPARRLDLDAEATLSAPSTSRRPQDTPKNERPPKVRGSPKKRLKLTPTNPRGGNQQKQQQQRSKTTSDPQPKAKSQRQVLVASPKPKKREILTSPRTTRGSLIQTRSRKK